MSKQWSNIFFRNIFFRGIVFFHPWGPRGPNIFFLDFFRLLMIPWGPLGIPGGPRGPRGEKTTNNTVRGRGSARAFLTSFLKGAAYSSESWSGRAASREATRAESSLFGSYHLRTNIRLSRPRDSLAHSRSHRRKSQNKFAG